MLTIHFGHSFSDGFGDMDMNSDASDGLGHYGGGYAVRTKARLNERVGGVAARLPAEIVIFARSGWQLGHIIRLLPPAVETCRMNGQDIVIGVDVSINNTPVDLATGRPVCPLSQFEDELEELHDLVTREAGDRQYWKGITAIERGSVVFNGWQFANHLIEPYEQFQRQLLVERHGRLYRAWFEHFRDTPGLTFDQLHPNPAGHALLSEGHEELVLRANSLP